MSKQFLTLPMSHFVERSTSGPDTPDEVEIFDDSEEDMEPPTADDAAAVDDHNEVGAPWAPTAMSLLRHRLLSARAALQARLARIDAASNLAGRSSSDEEGARLAVRDAPGEANKPALDRWEDSVDAAIAIGLGRSDPPRQVKDARQIESWADGGGVAPRSRLGCDCEQRLAGLSKDELIGRIRAHRATAIPEAMLRRSYTRRGLVALLCAHLCQEPVLAPERSLPHAARPSVR